MLNLNWFVLDIATVVGYVVVSRPFLDLSHPRHLKSTHSELLEVKNNNRMKTLKSLTFNFRNAIEN